MSFDAVFTGTVVAEPRHDVAYNTGQSLLEFPVYVNHAKKDRKTGEFVKTGDVSKIRVTVWGELAENLDVQKHDLVKVEAGLVEKGYTKADGVTKGRSLQTSYVKSVVIVHKAEPKNEPVEPPAEAYAYPDAEVPF